MNPRVSLPDGAGFYCWMIPDNQSLLRLGSIRNKSHPLFKHYNSTRLHVTVMYSEVQPEQIIMPRPRLYKAILDSFEVWITDKIYLVGILNSYDIEALNGHFACLGAQHTYDPYVPHVTLGEFSMEHQEIYEYCYLLNQTERPKELVFGPEVLVDTIN